MAAFNHNNPGWDPTAECDPAKEAGHTADGRKLVESNSLIQEWDVDSAMRSEKAREIQNIIDATSEYAPRRSWLRFAVKCVVAIVAQSCVYVFLCFALDHFGVPSFGLSGQIGVLWGFVSTILLLTWWKAWDDI